MKKLSMYKIKFIHHIYVHQCDIYVLFSLNFSRYKFKIYYDNDRVIALI